MTRIIIEYPGYRAAFYVWEGPYNRGIVDGHKRTARDRGGRVVAVVRPK